MGQETREEETTMKLLQLAQKKNGKLKTKLKAYKDLLYKKWWPAVLHPSKDTPQEISLNCSRNI